jgi:hypothetical protein
MTTATQTAGLPPEEKFWQRYSPHREMPVSAASSLALHALVIGGLLLLAWLGWLGFQKPQGTLPVEPVRLLPPGSLKDSPVKPRLGDPDGSPAVAEARPDPKPGPAEPDPKRPTLDPPGVVEPPEKKPVDSARLFPGGNPRSPFDEIKRAIEGKTRADGPNPRGDPRGDKDSPSLGGDKNRRPLTVREQRMERWAMVLPARTGTEYLGQLRTLGAILAIPVEDGKAFKVVRDLSGRGPAKLLDEDLSTLQRIYWYDHRPESVRSLMAALRCDLQPRYVVAFMPQALEERLLRLEKEYRGLREEQIKATQFEFRPDGRGGFSVVVVSQTPR